MNSQPVHGFCQEIRASEHDTSLSAFLSSSRAASQQIDALYALYLLFYTSVFAECFMESFTMVIELRYQFSDLKGFHMCIPFSRHTKKERKFHRSGNTIDGIKNYGKLYTKCDLSMLDGVHNCVKGRDMRYLLLKCRK